jgi:hypothetical protein
LIGAEPKRRWRSSSKIGEKPFVREEQPMMARQKLLPVLKFRHLTFAEKALHTVTILQTVSATVEKSIRSSG